MIAGNHNGVVADAQDFLDRAIPLADLERPHTGEIHVWFLDLAELAGALRDALDGHRSAPADFTAGQLLFARRFYLRLLLGAYLGLPGKVVKISRKNRGKPVLDQAVHDVKLHFSMAKSEHNLLVGFSTSSHLGVDLEPTSRRARNAMGVARRYFSPDEAGALEALPTVGLDAAFLRVWACKEAVVKASGYGIANQFARFTVETDLALPAAVLDFDGKGPDGWTLALVRPGGGFLGAVAVRQDISTLKAFRLLPVPHSSA